MHGRKQGVGIGIAIAFVCAVGAVASPLGALGGQGAGETAQERAGASQAKVAKKLARKVSSAKSDRARERALRKVFKALNLGVYRGTGKPVVQGRVRDGDDPYLYEFELQMVGDALARGDRSTSSPPRSPRRASRPRTARSRRPTSAARSRRA